MAAEPTRNPLIDTGEQKRFREILKYQNEHKLKDLNTVFERKKGFFPDQNKIKAVSDMYRTLNAGLKHDYAMRLLDRTSPLVQDNIRYSIGEFLKPNQLATKSLDEIITARNVALGGPPDDNTHAIKQVKKALEYPELYDQMK